MRAQFLEAAAVTFFVAVAIFILHQSSTDLAEKGVASGGALYNAAFVPRYYAWILLVLCGVQALNIVLHRRFIDRPPTGKADQTQQTQNEQAIAMSASTRSWLKAMFSAILLLLYVIVLNPVGYLIATPAFVFVLCAVLGERSPVLMIVWPLALTLGLGFIFGDLFNVVLPTGVFELEL